MEKNYNLVSHHLAPRQGQAILAMVFLTGSVMVMAVTAIAFLAASFVQVGYGFQASNQALGVAWAGAHDGLFQLVRNKDFSSPAAYSVPVGSSTAQVTVTQNDPVPAEATILSAATVSRYGRSVEIVVSIVTSTGQISPIVWHLK